ESDQILLFLDGQVKLLNEVEVFHRILQSEASPVVQIGWGVLDASQGERLDGTVVGHHHAIHQFLHVEALRLEVVHAVIGVVRARVAGYAPALSVKERFTPQFAGARLGAVQFTVNIQLGSGREVENLHEFRHGVELGTPF